MKTDTPLWALMLTAALILGSAAKLPAPNCPTCFAYQGQLKVNGAPANGNYDLQFKLRDAAIGGNQIGPMVALSAIPVSAGKFTTTLDFGPGAFDGNGRWLEIAARATGGGAFVTLSPRQTILPAPTALFASTSGNAVTAAVAASVSPNAVTAANVQDASLTAAKFAGGQVVKSLNGLMDAVTLTAGSNVAITANGNTLQIAAAGGGGGGSNGWSLAGNSGTSGNNFLGTVDNTPLELRVNNRRVWRMEFSPYSPNLIGGSSYNYISNGVYGATIAGGGEGSQENRVGQPWGTVSGGYANKSDGPASTIGGGAANSATDIYATVPGGYYNFATGPSAVVAGGFQNSALKESATIGGGANNFAGQRNATIAGGDSNHIDSTPDSANSTIGGGSRNRISTAGISAVVAGGTNNAAMNPYSVIGGGRDNMAFAPDPAYGGQTVGGGNGNIASGAVATISGGSLNRTTADGATVGGGEQNEANGRDAVAPGGFRNFASGGASFAAGQNARAQHASTFVWNDGSTGPFASTGIGQFCVQAAGGVQLAPNTSLFCSSQTRQMLNLWGTVYGLGVQAKTMYFRTDGNYAGTGFAWYKGGIHSDAEADPGSGGTMLMRLSDTELDVAVDIRTCGSVYASGDFHAGAFCVQSDRNVKQSFQPVDAREVLRQLAAIPMQTWVYTNSPAVRHIGPMAQDFYAAFNVGRDDKHIATVDADGVAFAAIQGLHQIVAEQGVALKRKQASIDALTERTEKLEKLIGSLTVVKAGGGQ